MVSFFLLLAAPAAILLVCFAFFRGFSWRELSSHVVLQVVVAAVTGLIVACARTSDTEAWNGRVARKITERVGCGHSYQCACVPMCTGSGTSQVCTTVCQTCYEHSYDYDWILVTSNEERIEVARADRQGLLTPQRWFDSRIGDPTSVQHPYVNYVKAAPDAVFSHRKTSGIYASKIPAYPGEVYDYHRLDRLVLVGARVADAGAWNAGIAELSADIGAARQANVVVVITGLPRDFFFALEEAWIGGKKNDVVAVIGQGEDGRVAWAEVMAWTVRPEFKSKLRDDIMALPRADDPAGVLGKVREDVLALHQRKPMKDFAYLKSTITPSVFQWSIAMFLSAALSGLLAWLFHVHDPFGDAERRIQRDREEATKRSAERVAREAVERGDAESIEEAIKDLRSRMPADYRAVDRR